MALEQEPAAAEMSAQVIALVGLEVWRVPVGQTVSMVRE
jgi:hypothetical protein